MELFIKVYFVITCIIALLRFRIIAGNKFPVEYERKHYVLAVIFSLPMIIWAAILIF